MKGQIKSLGEAVGYIVIALTAQVLIVGTVFLWINHFIIMKQLLGIVKGYEEDGKLLFGSIPFTCILAWLAIFLMVRNIDSLNGRSARETMLINRIPIDQFILSLTLGLAVWCVNIAIVMYTGYGELFRGYILRVGSYLTLGMSVGSEKIGNMFIIMLAIIMIVPIVEEILFRGIIYKALKKDFSVALAISIQAVLFGLLHFYPAQIMYSILLGAILGYITYRTQSIYPAIIIHMINNALFIIVTRTSQIPVSSVQLVTIFVLGIVSTGILLHILRRNTLKEAKGDMVKLLEEVKGEENNELLH